MNLKKTALLLAATALLTASAFAVTESTPTFSTNTALFSGTTAAGVYAGDKWTGSGNSYTHTVVPLVVTISGVNCVYTTDGSTPSSTNGTGCATAVTIGALSNGEANKLTVKAIALGSGATGNSPLATWSFTVETTVQPPAFSILTSTGADGVAMDDSWTGTNPTTGATIIPSIHYELINTSATQVTPTAAAGTAYTPVSSTFGHEVAVATSSVEQTLSAVAYATGYVTSPVVSENYGTGYTSTGAVQFFVGAGSSAQFNEYALAFGGVLGNGTGAVCGGHHYSLKNGAQAVDSRSGQTPADTGNLVIVWDNSADGTGTAYPSPAAPAKICVYVSLDSTLGVKAFMNSNLTVPADFLNLETGAACPGGTCAAPGNLISPFWLSSVGATADESTIPADVLAAVQGQAFNVGVTDIRPEDAYFATTRALGTLNATRTGLGYGPGPIGNPILSVAGTSFNVVSFALTGKDPISGATQQAYTTVPIGAAPVVVMVNEYAAADSNYHFNDPTNPPTNISRFTLAGYLNGSITGTGAISPVSLSTTGQGSAPVNVWLREPVSGTYNTMEFNIPNSKEIASSQEIGVNPAVVATCPGTTSIRLGACTTNADANGDSGNPMFIKVGSAIVTTNPLGTVNSSGAMVGILGATRQRAIGTGEEVKQVALTINGTGACNSTTSSAKVNGDTFLETEGVASIPTSCVGADNLGYSFWGYGNMSSGNNAAAFTTKYLTVDGVDPLYASYSTNNGFFPVCDGTTYVAGTTPCPQLTFPNIANGSYPIWSVFRAVTTPALAAGTGANQIVSEIFAAAENNAAVVFDFIPLTPQTAGGFTTGSLQVLRSHYLQAGIAPGNGYSVATGSTYTNTLEKGGDVGGAVYTIQADLDHLAQYGTEILSVKQ